MRAVAGAPQGGREVEERRREKWRDVEVERRGYEYEPASPKCQEAICRSRGFLFLFAISFKMLNHLLHSQ